MPKCPFHKIVSSTTGDNLLFVSGSKFLLVDSNNGSILAAVGATEKEVTDQYPDAEWISQNLLFNQSISGIGWHQSSNTLAITNNNKDMQLWRRIPGKSWSLLNTRPIIKKTQCILFSPCGEYVFLGDKFGDVYRNAVEDPKKPAELILGHVSMLTDMSWSQDGKYIITADRDEKIRVSKYPHAFDIERFCLGHEQFISRILVLSNVVVSGGGDPFLIVWDYLAGTILQKLTVLDDKVDMKNTSVLSIEYCHTFKLIAVIFEHLNTVLIIDASNERKLVIKQSLETIHHPVDICFDRSGKLWMSVVAPDNEPSVYISEYIDEKYTALISTHNLLSNIRNYVTETVDELPLVFEFHKLRKWSGTSSYHDQKNAQKKQRDEVFAAGKKRQNPKEAFKPKNGTMKESDDAQPSKKKTKRGGKGKLVSEQKNTLDKVESSPDPAVV
ncbi:hypothetical protein BDV3_006368 [Batrachochytrium dendrobatidis]